MIKAPQLLADLTRLLKRLEEDLLRRIDEVTELKASLQRNESDIAGIRRELGRFPVSK